MTTTPQKSPLVLYVDDERGNRVVFEQSLAADFNLKVAADAATALTLMEQHEVAVLVTDMRMPTMSGEELLRIVKERWPQAIRMVVTAFSDVDPILRAINEGLVARYIIKPWVRTELVQVLRWATEAWKLGKDSAEVHRRLIETERLATLGSISGMLVHDLKQPLMSLVVNAELLKELADCAPLIRRALEQTESPDRGRVIDMVEELGQITDDVKTSVEHLNDLISSLRGFSKVRVEGVAPATDPIPILRHAMSVCQELAVKVRAQIDYKGPRELPKVRMPPTDLTQVLINLVANGAQAIAARGTPNGKVSIVAHEDSQGMLVVEVRDDGDGMPPEVLKRVGTPFFTTRSSGTGLGLANCQRLIGTAGGRMRIDSQVGVGTTVTILLPIAA